MRNTSRPARARWLFKLNNDRWKSAGWSRNTLFSLDESIAPDFGDFVLALINDCLMAVRWFPDVAGDSWLAEPGRTIPASKQALVCILGVLKPLQPYR